MTCWLIHFHNIHNINKLWIPVRLTSFHKKNCNPFQSSSSFSIRASFCICCIIYMYVLPSLRFLSSYFTQFHCFPTNWIWINFVTQLNFIWRPLSPHIIIVSVIYFFPHCFSQLNIEPNHTTLAGHSYEHDVVMASKYVIFFGFHPSFFFSVIFFSLDHPHRLHIFEQTLLPVASVEVGNLLRGIRVSP